MIIKEIPGLIEYLEGIEMTNEQLEQFVSKLVMRLSDIESLKISTETVKEAVRCEILSTFTIQRGNPADRSRADNRIERVVG